MKTQNDNATASRTDKAVVCNALVWRVLDYFRWKHRIESVDDIETTDTPGYWQIKAGCPGGENCLHASRIAGMCCDGTRPLTIYFAEHGVRDAQGRFVKPHRAWQAWREKFELNAQGEAQPPTK